VAPTLAGLESTILNALAPTLPQNRPLRLTLRW
jgi:hypothetical protein